MSELGITWTDEGERGVYVHSVPQHGLGHKATDVEARVLRRIDYLEARERELEAALHDIVANAKMVVDYSRDGATDCYVVTLDDMDAARAALGG